MNPPPDQLADEELPEPKKKFSLHWVTTIFVLFALYVLSTGPVLRWGKGGALTQTTVRRIYLTLVVLSERSKGVEKFFQWYIGLWMPATP